MFKFSYLVILFGLVQSMTDSCSYFSMWRVFDTLSSRGFAIPTLRSRWSLSMGLLRFSLFEAAKKSVFYQTRANNILNEKDILLNNCFVINILWGF